MLVLLIVETGTWDWNSVVGVETVELVIRSVCDAFLFFLDDCIDNYICFDLLDLHSKE